MSTVTSKYPECEKMHAVKEQSQKLGEFIEWLQTETDYRFGMWMERRHADDVFEPARVNIEELLAQYFHIDLDKVEQERRAMLKELQCAK